MCSHRRWNPTLSSSGHDQLKLVDALKAKKVVGNDRSLGANPKVTVEHLPSDAEVLAGGMEWMLVRWTLISLMMKRRISGCNSVTF